MSEQQKNKLNKKNVDSEHTSESDYEDSDYEDSDYEDLNKSLNSNKKSDEHYIKLTQKYQNKINALKINALEAETKKEKL